MLFFRVRCVAKIRLLFVLTFSLAVTSAHATVFNLYQGSPAGGTPDIQGWLSYVAIGTATETFNAPAGTTTLNTTSANSVHAGYGSHSPLGALVNPSFPTLDRSGGFRLRFAAQLNSESHSSNDRAGFSVIALSSDNKGIELGFWTDQIWAQEGGTANLFTKAESHAFDTTKLATYDLTIAGSTYTLSSGGSTILTNSIRDYTAFAGFPNVYAIPSFIFLGDDTGSAQANVDIASVALTIPVPEPATGILLIVGFAGVCVFRRSILQNGTDKSKDQS